MLFTGKKLKSICWYNFTYRYKKLFDIDLVFIAYGILPEQQKIQNDTAKTLNAININVLSVINLLTIISNEFEKNRHGQIAIISSVAADRGRASNYIYGSTKAAFTTYLSGLRNNMNKTNVKIINFTMLN